MSTPYTKISKPLRSTTGASDEREDLLENPPHALQNRRVGANLHSRRLSHSTRHITVRAHAYSKHIFLEVKTKGLRLLPGRKSYIKNLKPSHIISQKYKIIEFVHPIHAQDDKKPDTGRQIRRRPRRLRSPRGRISSLGAEARNETNMLATRIVPLSKQVDFELVLNSLIFLLVSAGFLQDKVASGLDFHRPFKNPRAFSPCISLVCKLSLLN